MFIFNRAGFDQETLYYNPLYNPEDMLQHILCHEGQAFCPPAMAELLRDLALSQPL